MTGIGQGVWLGGNNMPLTITLSTQLNVQQLFNVQHSPATLVNGQWVFRSLGLPSFCPSLHTSPPSPVISVFGIWNFALVSFGHRTSAACAPSNCAACHRQSAAGASNSTNVAIGQRFAAPHTLDALNLCLATCHLPRQFTRRGESSARLEMTA